MDWELIQDLCLGRDQMILKERRWLPQELGEEFTSYIVRLNRSFLFGGFSDTLEKLAARPFSREVVIKNKSSMPDSLRPMLGNVDYMGNDVTAFAKRFLKEGIKFGHSAVLVDMPPVEQNLNGTPLSIAEERELGIRPYWIHISPWNLIGWRTTKVAGRDVLTQLRYRENRLIPSGAFGDTMQEVIRVITAPRDGQNGTVVEFSREKAGDEFSILSQREHTYPGIPLVWLPINPTGQGLLRSTPPLKELAETNLEHWQKSSDNSNILRFVAIAMVLMTGLEESTEDDAATGGHDDIAWGVNQILHAPMGADGKYIEHSGQGIGALQKFLEKIEERMEQLGVEPLLARQMDVTATAQRRDDKKVTSSLQSWIRRLEQALRELFQVSAIWVDEDPSVFRDTKGADQDTPVEDAIDFDVFSDFGLKVATRDDADVLLRTWAAGALSDETLLNEFKKRSLIGEEIDIEEELERVRTSIIASQSREAPEVNQNLEAGVTGEGSQGGTAN